ncbi:GTPase [Sulfolobales archaeon HS-7]|nr:GTPase [Sulfolobales archaeon HS-7]
MYYVAVTGTAGAGKTTFVDAFSRFLEGSNLSSYIMNLDPAVENLPYVPDFDIRQIVDARSLSTKYLLGPNASLIASYDMLVIKAKEIKENLEYVDEDIVLIDTPGQIELFAFRNSGRGLLNLIAENTPIINLFLIDASLAVQPSSFISLFLLANSIKFKLQLPQINVISKSDLLTLDEIRKIEAWIKGEEILTELGTLDEYSLELAETVVQNLEGRVIFISSTKESGFAELYGALENSLARDMWDKDDE